MASPSGGSRVGNPPDGFPRVLVHLIYDDVDAAVGWMTAVCGFTVRRRARHVEPDGGIGRTQVQVLDSVVTVGRPSVHGASPRGGVASMTLVYVDDVDSRFERARAHGAIVVSEPRTLPWGDRSFQITDPEGHQWCFAQHVADVPPEECHGTHED